MNEGLQMLELPKLNAEMPSRCAFERIIEIELEASVPYAEEIRL
jgi:hypothetical protein